MDPLTNSQYLGEFKLAKNKYRRPNRLLENPDAIVIGSGAGGLAIAALLARRKGMKVLVLEANEVPGGCMHCHERGGFEFNSGIHSVGDMDPSVGRGMLRPTIDYVTEGRLGWAKMPERHEVASIGGEAFEWHSNHEINKRLILERFPSVAPEVLQRYFRLEERIEASVTGWALAKMLPNYIPFSVREGIEGSIGRLWRRYLKRSVAEVMSTEFHFPAKLVSALSYMYGNSGMTPAKAPFSVHAITLLHYRHGSYYPIGGPAQIAESIIPTIETRGGQIAVDCKVEEILVENDRSVGVRLADNTEVHSKSVVSDGSAYTTLMELLPREVSERYGYPAHFAKLGPSPAHMYMFLGYDEPQNLPAHVIWHLPDFDIEAADERYRSAKSIAGSQACYIMSPSARDPVFSKRYPGKSTVIMLAETLPEWVDRWQSNPAFRAEFGGEIEASFLTALKRHIPCLINKRPAFMEIGMPVGCNPWAWMQASYGVEASTRRFIDHSRWLRPQTSVKGLYLTGHDAFLPGFAGALLSARVCYSALTGNILFMARNRIGAFP